MERYSKSPKASKGLFKQHSKFTPEKASKRNIKVSLFETTDHNKRYQKYMQRKRDIEMEMDKVKVTIGDETFSFLHDGTWQNSASNQEPNSTLQQKKKIEKLEMENSRLKLSYELLLNMVISKNCKIDKLESELKKFRGIISKPSMLFPDSDSTDS